MRKDRTDTARRIVMFTVGMMTLFGLASTASGQSFHPQRLLALDGAAEDHFGANIAVSGDVALIAAPSDDTLALHFGSAYVFRFNGAVWIQEQKLLPSQGPPWVHSFGSSVALSGEVALVGAHSGLGTAYVFRFDGLSWVEEQELLVSPTGQLFGASASLDDDVAIVGAPFDDDDGSKSGSAHIFRYDGATWVYEQELIASDGASNDEFGTTVAIHGDVAIVGAPLDDDAGSSSGSSYIFRFNGATWVEEQKLTAADAASGDQFGLSVSISGDAAIVGAPDDDDGGNGSGAVYAFRFDGASWIEEQELAASDAASFDAFGTSVSLDGSVAISGAPGDDDGGTSSGSAYVFSHDGSSWIEQRKLTAPDGADGDTFGEAVSVGGHSVMLGAGFHDGGDLDSGAVHVIDLRYLPLNDDCNTNGVADLLDLAQGTAADCNDNLIPDSCDIADGFSEDVNGNGVPDECENLCPADLNDDGVINVLDLLELLAAWGVCG